MSPMIPAVLRVMTGWFAAGIGALNLAVEADGGLTVAYTVFHVTLLCGGLLLLSRRRLLPSRPATLLAGVVVAAGMVLGLHPYPPYGAKFLVFWGCAGLLLLAAAGLAEQRLPERRTPVDLARYSGHAEPGNVGGLP